MSAVCRTCGQQLPTVNLLDAGTLFRDDDNNIIVEHWNDGGTPDEHRVTPLQVRTLIAALKKFVGDS